MDDALLVHQVQGHRGFQRYRENGISVAFDAGFGRTAPRDVLEKLEIAAVVYDVGQIPFPLQFLKGGNYL